MKKISFVIPCYKSTKTVGKVIDEIKKIVSAREEYDFEVVAVNDCSPDNTWEVLTEIARKNKRVKAINLAKNMNRPGAVMAGLNIANGDYVVMMDDDGQCPMDHLFDLVSELEEGGHDVAMAKYIEYKQGLFKSFGTWFNRKMTEIIMEKPKRLDFTNFIIMKKYVKDEIVKYKNPYPYFTGLLLRTTKDIVNVKMEERERLAGSTNFTLKKMVSLWMNGFTAFSIKPLRIATVLGFISAMIGFIFGVVVIIKQICSGFSVPVGYSSIMAVILFIGGIIMLMLGLIGEYLGRIYISINNSPQYVIKETINVEEK